MTHAMVDERCEFVHGAHAGEARCRKCGFVVQTSKPPDRIVKRCERLSVLGARRLSFRERSAGVARAVKAFVCDAFRVVDEATYRARLAACEACARREGKRCGECGCNIELKARGRAFDCPLGKWPRGGKEEPTRPVVGGGAARLLLSFPHGLGDAVQFTTVLLHLQKHRPDWKIDIVATLGAHSVFQGLANRVWLYGSEPPAAQYDVAREVPFPEPDRAFRHHPSTKAERCLLECFGIEPEVELCRYSVAFGDAELARAHDYFKRIRCRRRDNGRYAAALVHYQGNSARARKNLDERKVKRLCRNLRDAGLTPVILDWDRRSRLVDGVNVFCPDVDDPLWQGYGAGDGATIAALTSIATLFVGIDSGPLHIAGATDTPTFAVWTRHHPLHYFGMAPNVTHLVPRNHRRLIRGDADAGMQFFASHYRFAVVQA